MSNSLPPAFQLLIASKRAERGTRQSIVSRGTGTGLSLRLLVQSGSPRAYGPRDDNGVVKDALAMTIIGEKKRSELTFHSLPFNLHSFSLVARFVWPRWASALLGPSLP